MTELPEVPSTRLMLNVGDDVDAFVVEELLEAFDDVGVFAVDEAGVALDDGDARAEATNSLG